jgi:hypothetical protein
MRGAPPVLVGTTVLAAIATCTLVVGLTLFLLGTYRLGNIVRFAPYPVIGGFLAGSGWLLLIGSFRVVSGQSFSFLKLREFLATGSLAAWVPCAAFGVIAYLGVRFSRHYMTLPALVVGSILGFYTWVGFNHHSLEVARQHGWILTVPPDAGVKQILTFPSLLHADWGVVFTQYPLFIALLLTSIVSILLNTSALELAADEEIDLNRELRAAGLANVVGGFAGGMIGFQSLSLSSLAVGMGVKSRIVGLISAGTCLLLLGFGTEALGYIPKFVLGGILFYNGLAFLTEWTVDSYFRLIREDYFLVIFILAIVALWGYLQGVGAGIIVATVLFVLKYSTVNVISSTLSGDSHHSTVDRSPVEARLLNDHGGQISSTPFANARPTPPSRSWPTSFSISSRSAASIPPAWSASRSFRAWRRKPGSPSSPPPSRPTFKTAFAIPACSRRGPGRSAFSAIATSASSGAKTKSSSARSPRRAPKSATCRKFSTTFIPGRPTPPFCSTTSSGRRSARTTISCCRAIRPTISSSSSPAACASWSSSTTAA